MIINDLTNTDWLFNNEINDTNSVEFSIDFTSNGNIYDTLRLTRSTLGEIVIYYVKNQSSTPVYISQIGWENNNYKQISITSGNDTTTLSFINWLQENATLTNMLIAAPIISLEDGIISWEDITNATDYEIYYAADNVNYEKIDTIQTTTYKIVNESGSYYVVATNNNFDSANSNVVLYTQKNILLHPQENGVLDKTTDLFPKTKLENIIDIENYIINEVLPNSNKLVTSGGIYNAITSIPKEIIYVDYTWNLSYQQIATLMNDDRTPVVIKDNKHYTLVYFSNSYAVFSCADATTQSTIEIIELSANATTPTVRIISNENVSNKTQTIDSSNKNSISKYPSLRAITNYVDNVDTILQNAINVLDANKLEKIFTNYAIASQLGDSDAIAINSGNQVYYLTIGALKEYIETFATDHYKGDFVSLQALETAYPIAEPGDYAFVVQQDPDNPTKVILVQYIWDDTDQEWQEISGGGGNYVTTTTFAAFQQALLNGTTVVGKSQLTNQLPLSGVSDFKKMLYVDQNGNYALLNLNESLIINNNALAINFDSDDLVDFIELLFLTKYTITSNITNGEIEGSQYIYDTRTATLELVPDENYGIPRYITVTGATFVYNNQTGEIVLSNATQNVTIQATCPRIYTLTISVNNGTYNVTSSYLNTGNQITDGAVVEITPNTNYYLPDTISVVNATYDEDVFFEDSLLQLTEPTGNVTVSITCVPQLAQPSISISNDTLTIQDVANATQYEIYANGVKVGEINA